MYCNNYRWHFWYWESDCCLFCQEDAKVIFTGRNAELGKSVEREFRELGGAATFISADHTNPQDCHRVVEESLAKYGQIDILFNNAGIVVAGTAEETSEESWALTLELNITAVWRMSKLVIPIMRSKKNGIIVNYASDWGVVGGD
jgi:meso-butanediol dehydrogenase/(S,S)-butanediol dehydrogenase/diacetyl reductase